MSTLAAVVRVRLLTSATISQERYLGTAPTRFFHLYAPQNVRRPYALYAIDTGAPEHQMLGASGLWQGRISVDIYADTISAMEAIVEQFRLTCDGYRGDVVVDGTTYSVRRLHLTAQDEEVIYPDPAKPKPVIVAGLSLDIAVTQSIPTF